MVGKGQRFRLETGGRVDRSKPLRFIFNGREYGGYEGDTAASALLANGVHLVGRSFKYHRPRGIVGSGLEEPNALLQVGTGARTTPNLRATEVHLTDGMVLEERQLLAQRQPGYSSLKQQALQVPAPGLLLQDLHVAPQLVEDLRRVHPQDRRVG